MKISTPATRYCPECDMFGLEVTGEDLNIFKCKLCGSVWQRLRPINIGDRMINVPDKLKKIYPYAEEPFFEGDELFNKSMNEFEIAWKEFFKDKPKTDEEEIQQQEEFSHWYNYVRKQSDTKMTPKEMFDKKIGNRMMEFSVDEEGDEDEFY